MRREGQVVLLVSYTGGQVWVPPTLLLIQLPANIPGEAAENNPSVWALPHVQVSRWVSGSWLSPGCFWMFREWTIGREATVCFLHCCRSQLHQILWHTIWSGLMDFQAPLLVYHGLMIKPLISRFYYGNSPLFIPVSMLISICVKLLWQRLQNKPVASAKRIHFPLIYYWHGMKSRLMMYLCSTSLLIDQSFFRILSLLFPAALPSLASFWLCGCHVHQSS